MAASPVTKSAGGRWSSKLHEQDRGVEARRSGLASVRLECSHCSASVTEAVDGTLPPHHQSEALFVPAYKEMRRVQTRSPETGAPSDRPGPDANSKGGEDLLTEP